VLSALLLLAAAVVVEAAEERFVFAVLFFFFGGTLFSVLSFEAAVPLALLLSMLHNFVFSFAPCLIQTPPLFTWLVHPGVLQIFLTFFFFCGSLLSSLADSCFLFFFSTAAAAFRVVLRVGMMIL